MRFNDELGINVHALKTGGVPDVHKEINALQSKWWWNESSFIRNTETCKERIVKCRFPKSRHSTRRSNPCTRILRISACAGVSDVAAIQKKLANLQTMTVGKSRHEQRVEKERHRAVGALAVFGLAWENVNLEKNILSPPQYVQASLTILNRYARCYEEAVQSNGVSRDAWGRMTDCAFRVYDRRRL